MTLSVLLIIITAVALFITMLNGFVVKNNKNWIYSFLQSFSGVLFLISGFVKAVDPLGTTYKMEDYFHAFTKHLADTPFRFLEGFWHFLAESSVWVALTMILIELLIGLFLLIGSQRRFTSWVFFVMVVFFAILTGFTYLTGYVPPDASFFEFSKWGSWVKDQMEVSDCGCFGDFLKLDPFTSFLKDVVLLVPAILFLIKPKNLYQYWNSKVRAFVTIMVMAFFSLFAIYNTWMNLPVFDFRPFKEGVDVRSTKAYEEEAMSNVEVLGYRLTNHLSGEKIELSMDDYLKNFKAYPKAEWDFEQIKTEPTIEPSKISDFVITGVNNEELSTMMLADPEYNLWVISPLVEPLGSHTETVMEIDTVWVVDSAKVQGKWVLDTTLQRVERSIDQEVYEWDKKLTQRYEEKVSSAVELMKEKGLQSFIVFGGISADAAASFSRPWSENAYVGTADAILLKTMIRSNPGYILAKDGVIIKKWHHKGFDSEELLQILNK